MRCPQLPRPWQSPRQSPSFRWLCRRMPLWVNSCPWPQSASTGPPTLRRHPSAVAGAGTPFGAHQRCRQALKPERSPSSSLPTHLICSAAWPTMRVCERGGSGRSVAQTQTCCQVGEKSMAHRVRQFDDETIQRLFGHEAAENEDATRLRQYYFKSQIYDRITSKLPLRILVGHKGIGKSALVTVASNSR